MTSLIAPATATTASNMAKPLLQPSSPATDFHTTSQSTNNSVRDEVGEDGPADEESVKNVKEKIEQVKTRVKEFEKRNCRRTHAVVWVNALIHGFLLLQTACASVNLGAFFYNDEWSNSLTWYSIFLYSLNIVLPILVIFVRFIEQKFVMLQVDDFTEDILEVINKMEADLDDLIKKKLESFYQLVKEEQASTSVGGHRGSHKFSFIKLHKLQTPNESESQNLQTLVENVKHHYLEVDQRVNFRRNMIFWIGVVLHVTNLVLSACAGTDLGTYPYQKLYHVNWYSIVLFSIIILFPVVLIILKAIEQKCLIVKPQMLSERKIVGETMLAINKARIDDYKMNKPETQQAIQQLIRNMNLNLDNILIQSQTTYDDEVERLLNSSNHSANV